MFCALSSKTSLIMGMLYREMFSAILFTFLIWSVSADQTTTQVPDSNTLEPVNPFNLPSNMTLRKCRCQGNQELRGSECQDQETYVAVVDLVVGQQLAFRTSEFANVTVGDIQCPPGLTKGMLLNYIDHILVLTSGELYWVNGGQSIENYCVEHVPGGWGAHVCLWPPAVPRCCPRGHAMGPDDSCILQKSNLSFAPPLMLNNKLLEKVNVDDSEIANITCRGVSVMQRVNLDEGEGDLLYGAERALLSYKAPAYVPYVEPEEDYCVGLDEMDKDKPQYVAKFCYADPKEEHQHACRNATCVRKCCLSNQFLLDSMCADLTEEEEPWQPIFHEKDDLTPGAEEPKDLLIVFGLPFCNSFYKLMPHLIEYDKSYLLRDGTLHSPGHQDFNPDSYCLDTELEKDGVMRNIAVVCAPEATCQWKAILDVVLFSLSCVFLVATLAVYLGVPELRDRTNGRCLISMVAAMLATYISLIVNNQERNPTDIQCLLTGFFGHVFGLAIFFWLNVMCFDMWSTLRSSQQQHQSKKTFIKYSIYAWGIPLMVGIATRIIDHVQPSNFILPNFLEDETCWFRGDAEYWLYLSGIIVLLLSVNLFFFIHVAITLARKLRQRQSVFDNSNSRTSNSNKTKKQALLYVKLFVVMGIVWIADVISTIKHRNTCTYWVLTDIINGLQGIFIFLVAVLNKDNLKKVRAVWNPRVQSVSSKISTLRGRSPLSRNKKANKCLATSESSGKTSVSSLPRKISTTSIPLQSPNMAVNKDKRITELGTNSDGSRDSKSPQSSRKVSVASNLETIPMNPLEE